MCIFLKFVFTIIHVGLVSVHKLTFLSSPPVAAIRWDLRPIVTQLTFDGAWAVNSASLNARLLLLLLILQKWLSKMI